MRLGIELKCGETQIRTPQAQRGLTQIRTRYTIFYSTEGWEKPIEQREKVQAFGSYG